jgi:hypothetical protein
MNQLSLETTKNCHYPWTWMMVTADGLVTPCCFASGHLGSLHEATAEAIWNGPIAMELRQFIKADKIHPVCAGAPCKFVQNALATNKSYQHLEDDRVDMLIFVEALYLEANPDVKIAIENGQFKSGLDHFEQYGRSECRRLKL